MALFNRSMIAAAMKQTTDIKVGDKVKVISSPYISVSVGSIATVKSIGFNKGGKRCHLYVLSDLPHKRFWKSEIQLVKGE